jgi:hypothetical protein
MHLLTLGHPSLRLLCPHLLLRVRLLGVHLPLGLRLLNLHVMLGLRLLRSHLMLGASLLGALRVNLLPLVILRSLPGMHLRLPVAAAVATAAESSGEMRIAAATATVRTATAAYSSEMWVAAATATTVAVPAASRSEMRVTSAAAAAVRAPAPVPAARTCVGCAGNGERRGACEKNEPFHGETPYGSTAKRSANRPVPPFMCLKGEYRPPQLA